MMMLLYATNLLNSFLIQELPFRCSCVFLEFLSYSSFESLQSSLHLKLFYFTFFMHFFCSSALTFST